MTRLKWFWSAVALAALGALCIGVAVLAAALFEDPVLYDEVTRPAQNAYEEMKDDVEQRLAEREAEREVEREAERQRELEAQREAVRQHQIEAEREARRQAQELAAQEASAPTIRSDFVFADPTITEFDTEQGREILTGGNVLLYYYNQGDEEWAEQLFGRDPIGRYGCGPTALAMAIASMSDDTATPASVAQWAADAGYCSPHSGSYLSIVQGAAERYGLEYTALGALDAESLYSYLSEGGVIVALMGPGHFTGRGHFVLFHGVTLSGGILVADPNSRENSLVVWEPQLLIDELSRSRHDGAPLWLLTKPLTL